jgi:hypothetical protein
MTRNLQRRSGAEEYKPADPEDNDGKPRADHQKRQDGRTGFRPTCFSRTFDNLVPFLFLPLRLHATAGSVLAFSLQSAAFLR